MRCRHVVEARRALLGEPFPRYGTSARISSAPVDVLILTALQDELEAVLDLAKNGAADWQTERDREGFRCYRHTFPNDRGGTLSIAAAWTGDMGDRNTAIRAQQLVKELSPECLGMCGICAGYRKKVALGDVIIADQIYSYDEGKVVAARRRKPEMLPSLRTFDLAATWKMDAAYLARELDVAPLSEQRPPSKAAEGCAAAVALAHALRAPDRRCRCAGG